MTRITTPSTTKLLLLWSLTMTAASTSSSASAFGLSDNQNVVGTPGMQLHRHNPTITTTSVDGRLGLGRLNRIRGGGSQNIKNGLSAATIAPPPSRFFDNSDDRGGGGGNNIVANVESGSDEEKKKKKSFLARHAFACACVITTVNAVAADLLTQLVFEAGPWNPKRSLVFAAFGFIYQGMAQYFIVNKGWEYLFPGNSKRNVVAKVCGMNLLSDPLLFMPCFYIFKEVLASGGNFGFATIKTALLAYKGNCLMDWRNSWSVWFPGHAVTYGVMPSHKRIPWMAFLSFFYMCILSITRG